MRLAIAKLSECAFVHVWECLSERLSEYLPKKGIRKQKNGEKRHKKGVKQIVITVIRHVAAPKAYNNDSSRPGRLYHALQAKGYNNPSHEHQSLSSMLVILKLPHFDNRITPFDVNLKNSGSLVTPTHLPSVQNPSAKILHYGQISKLLSQKIVVVENKPPYNTFSPHRLRCVF